MRRKPGSSRATLAFGGILHQMGYEGSPPLWHLLLWALIRLHLPYAALGAVSLTLVAAGMYIWLRWSPLPAPVRLLVPFAFYYQYQYAVVARSYALSTLLAFAAVALWRAKPVRVIPLGLVVALLAQTNMHGFTIAGGIACAFAWEYIRRVPQTASFANPDFPDQRSRCFRPGFRGHCQVSGKAISRLQFQGGDPTSKGNRVGKHRASGLAGLPELSIALGLNITWGLSLLLIFTIWAIAVKKRIFVLPLIATLLVAYQMSTGQYDFLRNRRRAWFC